MINPSREEQDISLKFQLRKVLGLGPYNLLQFGQKIGCLLTINPSHPGHPKFFPRHDHIFTIGFGIFEKKYIFF